MRPMMRPASELLTSLSKIISLTEAELNSLECKCQGCSSTYKLVFAVKCEFTSITQELNNGC